MNSPFDLNGRVVLVTGGNQGIGLGIAKAVAGAGANVVIWGRAERQNSEAVNALEAFGTRILAQRVDVSDETAIIAGIDEAAETFGRLDAVFASAGSRQRRERFESANTSTWRDNIAVNLEGVFWTFREACRVMKDQAQAGGTGGSLVAISSLGAVQGIPRQQAYAAAKGAIECMTRSIAVEFARYGIRANVLRPGWIETEMTAPVRESEVNKIVVGRIPMRRWGTPDDIGGIAIYFAADASRYHTGDTVLIDGGYAIS